jgi:hypothetical protein
MVTTVNTLRVGEHQTHFLFKSVPSKKEGEEVQYIKFFAQTVKNERVPLRTAVTDC